MEPHQHRRASALLTVAALVLTSLAATQGEASAQSSQEANRAASRLEGFKNLTRRALRADASGGFQVSLPGNTVTATVFSTPGASGTTWYGAIKHNRPAAFKPSGLARNFSTIAGDIRFTDVVVLVAQQAGSVNASALPASLGLAAYATSGQLRLEAGVNVFLSGLPGQRGLLGKLRRVLGINAPIKIHGSASAKVAGDLFASSGARQRQRGQAGPIALTVQLPSFTPEPFRSIPDKRLLSVRFDRTALSVRTQGRDFSVTGTSATSITINGRSMRVASTMRGTRQGGGYTLAVSGKVRTGRGAPAVAGFTLSAVGVEGELTGTTTSLGVAADVRMPNGRTVSGVASLVVGTDRRRRKRLQEVKLDVKGSFSLADMGIPLPAAREIRFADLSLGMNVPNREGFIGGTIQWRRIGLNSRGVLFARNRRGARPGFALFAEMAQTSIKRLVPRLPRAMMDIPIPQGAVVLSTVAMNDVPVSQLPSPAQAIVTKITNDTNATVSVQDGFNILTKLSGPLGGVAQKLGISGNLIVGGSVGGVVSGNPGFSLYAQLPRFQLPSQMSGKFLAVRSARPKFFVKAQKSAVHVGVELEAKLRFGREEPVFAGKMFGTLTPAGASLGFSGKLKGQWRNPMGLRGITFEDMVAGFAVGASASADIALGGKVRIGRFRYGMQSFVSLQVSPALGIPVPKALGVNITGNEFGMLTPLELMDALKGAVATGPLKHAIRDRNLRRMLQKAGRHSIAQTAKRAIPFDLLKVKNFQLYLATPGVSHPDLPQLSGMGFKLKGQVYLGNRLLGSTDSYLKMPEGLKLDVRTRAVALGPLRMSNARMYVRVPIPGLSRDLPELGISGRGGVKPFTAGLDVKMGLKQVSFAADVRLGPLGSARFQAKSIGRNLMAPKDFALTAEVRGFDRGFRRQLSGALNAYVRNGPAQRAHRAAVAKVAKKKRKLAAARKVASRDVRAATRDITKAQKQVNVLNGEIRKINKRLRAWNKALKHAKAWPPNPGNIAKYSAKISWGNTKRASLYVSLKTAQGTLAAAKATVKVTGVEMHPKVIAARDQVIAAERDAAFLKIGADSERALGNFAKVLLRAATRDFRIHRIALINARLAGALRGHKQKLLVDMTIKGKRIKHTFQIDIRGPWRLNFSDLPKKIAAVFKK